MKRNLSIQTILSGYPSANLTLAPTAIQHLARLSSQLGRSIYIKRDDLTGFGIGGNKIRKLDYLLGDALKKRADTLMTKNATSFSRNAAAAGKALGFEVHVFIAGEESSQNRPSQDLFRTLDARLHFVHKDELDAQYAKAFKELRAAGRSIYELHPGGSDTIGSLSYLSAFDEILEYSARTGIYFGKIIHATGSTATQVGLVLGQRISGYETDVIGMAISQKKEIQRDRVLDLARRSAEMLSVELDESKVIVDDNYIGPGYPTPSPEGLQAASFFARHEGILLDQAYGGKAAAGLIDYAVKGRFSRDENVLFIHTGGNSDLYY